MKLTRLSDRIWYFPMEEERDRPNLGYIRGDRWSLAVDAGHSDDHVRTFYQALEEEGLPLPALTVFTHWHWDHTFGFHAANGLSLANRRTSQYLRAFREKVAREGREAFLSLHESVQREYAGGRPVIILPSDLEYEGQMLLDAGNCPIRVFQAPAPHTDDSSLVSVPKDKALFLGDAPYSVFETGEKAQALCRRLEAAIRETKAEICLEGHYEPQTLEKTVSDLYED